MIEDSFLATAGNAIDAQIRGRNLFLENSVLASRENVMSLSFNGSGTDSDGRVVLNQCTLSAVQNFFVIEDEKTVPPPNVPVQIFARRCVFGAPMRGGGGSDLTTLMTADPQILEQDRLQWIGDSNGYFEKIVRYLDTTGGAAVEPQSFENSWRDFWGPDRERTPLTEPGGVIFNEPLQQLRKLVPANFTLLPSAPAQKWADGDPLGADISQINFENRQSTSKPAASSRRKTKGKRKTGF